MKRAGLAAVLLLICTAGWAFRDPTQPPGFIGSRVKAVQGFVLRGILAADQRQYALINGRYVGVGEQVAKATVVSINRDAVVLQRGQERITLPLFKEQKIIRRDKR